MEYVMFLVAGAFIALAALERKMRREMERKIGDVFEIDGKKYKVADNIDDYMGDCDKCIFDGNYRCMSKKREYCEMSNREDGKDVYFIEVKE